LGRKKTPQAESSLKKGTRGRGENGREEKDQLKVPSLEGRGKEST